LAANCVWVSPEERVALIHGYNENIFREVVKAGSFQIQANESWHRESTIIDVRDLLPSLPSQLDRQQISMQETGLRHAKTLD
jgi:hypothetical protein